MTPVDSQMLAYHMRVLILEGFRYREYISHLSAYTADGKTRNGVWDKP